MGLPSLAYYAATPRRMLAQRAGVPCRRLRAQLAPRQSALENHLLVPSGISWPAALVGAAQAQALEHLWGGAGPASRFPYRQGTAIRGLDPHTLPAHMPDHRADPRDREQFLHGGGSSHEFAVAGCSWRK